MVVIMLILVVLVAVPLATGNATDATDNPSVLEFFPRARPAQNLIWFRASGPQGVAPGWQHLTSQLTQLTAEYNSRRVERNENLTMCSDLRPENGKVCFFDLDAVAPQCTAAQDFGYPRQSPCVFLQFANVTGWDPEPLSAEEASQVLPAALQPLITPGLLFLHCDGDSPADRENIGPVVYYPYPGFRTVFFPYTGQPDYMSPLVALHFQRPQIGVVISVRCRLLARNPPPGNASAEIRFQLLVD